MAMAAMAAMAALSSLRCNVLLRHCSSRCCNATRRCGSRFCGAATALQQQCSGVGCCKNNAMALGAARTTQRRWALQQQRGATVQRDALLRVFFFFFLMTLGKFKSLQTLRVHARKRETESEGELLNLVWSCSFKLVYFCSILGLLVGRDIRI
jgi:hypothetical protein